MNPNVGNTEIHEYQTDLNTTLKSFTNILFYFAMYIKIKNQQVIKI